MTSTPSVCRVSPPNLTWSPDVLPGFERSVLPMPRAWDGEVDAVLVRRAGSPAATTSAVLYVHGFGDYFFQSHLAEFYEEQGLAFYAIDLRRHGRALHAGQHPNTTRSIDEYVADIDRAVDVLRTQEGVRWLLVNGHSTGGLAAVIHASRGARRADVDALFLNSPFLDMNLPRWQEVLVEPLLSLLGRFFPDFGLPSLDAKYGESIHSSARGRWDFDLAWKPLAGFPAKAGWFRAIHLAQKEVERGLGIRAPILLLHAARSSRPKDWHEDVVRTDIVLDVADMDRLAPRLGSDVTVIAIPDGIHDLVLSAEEPRRRTFELLSEWLRRVHRVPAA